MKKEFSFIVHTMQNLHPNDPARMIYRNIWEHLLKIDYRKTISYIKIIKREEDWNSISGLFPYISFHFQKKEFIDIIREKNQEFIENKFFQSVLLDIQAAEDAIEDFDGNEPDVLSVPTNEWNKRACCFKCTTFLNQLGASPVLIFEDSNLQMDI